MNGIGILGKPYHVGDHVLIQTLDKNGYAFYNSKIKRIDITRGEAFIWVENNLIQICKMHKIDKR